MINWRMCVVAMLLVDVASIAWSQTNTPADTPTSVPRTVTQPPGPAPDHLTNKPRVKAKAIDPLAEAARRQSGIDEPQARNLLQSGGYDRISDLRAQPNSVWVWQADGMKDGRRVRVGIDYRGKVLELSTNAAVPCASPGIGTGVGSFGVGSRLSEATACAGR
jgi:hypothetical protein